MQKNKPISIELTEDFAKVVFDNNGLKSERICDLASLINILSSIDNIIALPILPFNCRRYIKKGSTVFLFLYYEEGVIQDFQYHKQKYKIPTPKTLVMLSLNDLGTGKYQLIATTFYALKDTYLNSDEISLYYWPFPNQSPSIRGTVCWGTDPSISQFKNSCDLFNMGSIYRIYFSANANDDYGWTFEHLETKMPDYIQNKDVFPYEKLRPVNKTIKDTIKDIMSSQHVTS